MPAKRKKQPQMTDKRAKQIMDMMLSMAYGGLVKEALDKGLVVDIRTHRKDDDAR